MTTQQLFRSPEHPDTVTHVRPANRIEFDLEPQDLLSFINYHYITAKNVRRQRFHLAVLGFGTLATLPLMCVLSSDKPAGEAFGSIWPMFLGPIGFLACFPLFYRWSLKATRRRLLMEGDERDFFGARSLSLEDYGVREATIQGETIRAWASVRKIIKVTEHALIYTSDTEAFVLPKRAFENESAYDKFLDLASRRARIEPETA